MNQADVCRRCGNENVMRLEKQIDVMAKALERIAKSGTDEAGYLVEIAERALSDVGLASRPSA